MPRAPSTQSSQSANFQKWSLSSSTPLVDTLILEKKEGRMANNGFKKSSWQAVSAAVQAAVRLSVTITQCKGHWQTVSLLY